MQAQYYQIEAERLQLSSSFGQVSIPIPYSSSMSLFSKILPVIRAEFKKTIQQPTNDLHNAPKPSLLTDMCPSTVWQATSSYSTPWYTPGLTSPTLVKCLFYFLTFSPRELSIMTSSQLSTLCLMFLMVSAPYVFHAVPQGSVPKNGHFSWLLPLRETLKKIGIF